MSGFAHPSRRTGQSGKSQSQTGKSDSPRDSGGEARTFRNILGETTCVEFFHPYITLCGATKSIRFIRFLTRHCTKASIEPCGKQDHPRCPSSALRYKIGIAIMNVEKVDLRLIVLLGATFLLSSGPAS